MKTLLKTTAIAATGLMMAACTQSGYTERNAAVGAGLGAAAGAVIGNNTGDGNAGRGAAIGAAVGLPGAAVGASGIVQQPQPECTPQPSGSYVPP